MIRRSGQLPRSESTLLRTGGASGAGGAGGAGGASGASGARRRVAEAERLGEGFSRAVDGALALAAVEEVARVLERRGEVATVVDKVVHLERLVLDARVDDGRLVDLLLDGDGRVNAPVVDKVVHLERLVLDNFVNN